MNTTMKRNPWRLAAALAAAAAFSLPAFADEAAGTSDGVYAVTLINVLPTEMAKGSHVHAMFDALLASARKQPGLIGIRVTQQVGQPYNFTLIEQWKDQAALDAATATDGARQFETDLQAVLSGPEYRRTFKAFD